MADTKISAMPAAAALTGTEITPLVQSGANVQTTTANFVGQTISAAPPTYRTALGLGTIATQNANNVSITGGSVNGTTVGAITKAAGSFTSLTATGTTTLATTLSGYLKGTLGVVSASATIPWADISDKPPLATSAYGSFYQDGVTTLSANISNGGAPTSISVDSTADFASSGYVLIDNEVFKYTGKTGTTFTGITRSQLGSSSSSHTAGAYVSEVQATGSSAVIGTLKISETVFSNNIAIDGVDTTRIVFANPGIYNIQISVQCINFSSIANLTLWFAQNDNDIDSSGSVIAVPGIHGGVIGATIISMNIFVETVANDEYVQLKFATDTADVAVATYPPGAIPAHPSSPAVILTASRVG